MGYSNQPVHGTQGYYATQQQHPQGSTYGYVNYPANQVADSGSHTNMETQSQSLSALNNFYYDTRRGTFDPRSYTQVENRVMTIQAGGLPFIGHGGISDHQVGQGHVVGGGGGDGGAQTIMSSQFQLPALDHLRTKNDLLHADRIMEQAQATIYERPAQMAAAGTAQVIQPEAYHIRSENNNHKYHMRVPSEVPKIRNQQRQPMHYTQSASIANSNQSYATESPPALTPTNSTQSYPSNSPVSPYSTASTSPIATHSAPAVYPSLPSSSASRSANGESVGIYNLGMNNGSGMASGTTTLGGQFPGDAHHRYGGGHLRRGRPLKVVPGEEKMTKDRASTTSKEKDMDEDMESSDESTTMALSRRSSSLSNGSPTPHHPSISISKIILDSSKPSSSASSPESSPEVGPSPSSSPTSSTNDAHDPVWLGIVRTLEDLRDWIRQRLENGEYEERNDNNDDQQVEDKKPKTKTKRESVEEREETRRTSSEIGVGSEAVYPILCEVRG